MIDLTFEVSGDKQLVRSLSRFGDDLKDMRPAFNEIIKLFQRIEKKQFDSEGSHGSGGWPDLNATYALWKSKNFPGKPILQRTQRLVFSLVKDTQDTVKVMKPMEFRMGTKVPYAIYHQEGTGRMPKRKVIDLSEEDKREWVKTIQRWLVNMAKQEGLHIT